MCKSLECPGSSRNMAWHCDMRRSGMTQGCRALRAGDKIQLFSN